MIKSFSKLLSFGLLVMLFAIFSCSREEDFVKQHHHQNNVSIQKKSFQELMKTEMFSKAYGKVANTKLQLRNAGRTALEDEFDFTIVEYAPINIVTDTTGWVTYNILIKKGPEEDLKFHNLVLKTKFDETVAAILKYELVEKAEKSEHDDTYKMDFSNIKVTPLPLEDQEKQYPCGAISITICCNTTTGGVGPWHVAGENCTNSNHMQTIWINVMCEDWSEEIPTAPSNSGGGGTGENPDNDYDPQDPDIHGNPPPDITAPVIEEEEIEEKPCDNLEKIKDNTTINDFLSDLRSKTRENKETMYTFNRNGNGVVLAVPATTTSTGSAAGILTRNTFGVAHTHQNGVYPMFMPLDLMAVCSIKQHYNPVAGLSSEGYDGLPFNIMVCESNTSSDLSDSQGGFAYIVIPNNPSAFNSVCQSQGQKLKELQYELQESFQTEGNWNTVPQLRLANLFLKMMNVKQNYDVSLYRVRYNSQGHATGRWEKVEMASQQYKAVVKPCE